MTWISITYLGVASGLSGIGIFAIAKTYKNLVSMVSDVGARITLVTQRLDGIGFHLSRGTTGDTECEHCGQRTRGSSRPTIGPDWTVR